MDRNKFVDPKFKTHTKIKLPKIKIKNKLLREFDFKMAVVILDAIRWEHFKYTPASLKQDASDLIDSLFESLAEEDDGGIVTVATGCFEVEKAPEGDGFNQYTLRLNCLDSYYFDGE